MNFPRSRDLALKSIGRIPFLNAFSRSTYRLKSFVFVTTLLISFISFSLAFFLAFSLYQGIVEHYARVVSRSVSQQAFDTLYQLMQKGWTKNELDELLFFTAGKKGNTEYRVKLHRNDGTETEDEVKSVLLRGVAVHVRDGFRLIDIYPVKAKQACMRCHRTVKEGSILAAVTVQQDIGPTLTGIKKKFVLFLLFLSLVPFIMASLVSFFLNTRFLKAVGLFHRKIKDVSSVGDLATLETISIDSGFVEFNDMLSELDGFVHRIKDVAVDKDILEHELHERKETELALKKSENILQAIIDAEPECVKLLDADANLIMMNRAGLSMMQADSLDQVKGKDICSLLIKTESRNAFRDLTKRVFGGESGILVFEMVGLRGRRLWLETHAAPFRNENDEVVGLLSIARDITVRKETEEALRESEERLRDLAESLPLTIFEIDLNGRLTYVNKTGLNVFGYSQQELETGLNVTQVIVPEDRDHAREMISRRLEGQPPEYREYKALRKDGTTFPITVFSNTIIRNDRTVGLRGIVSDVSERKKAEEQSLKVQKLESIGTLAGGIAHDFNNLLQGVFGYISLARLNADRQEKCLAALDQAEKALHMSVTLTNQLLTFSKGGQPVKKPIDLRPIIHNATKFALSGSRSDYHIAAEDVLWAVMADDGQVGQVIQNIVLNANQAMPEGGRVEIRARNVATDIDLPKGLGKDRYVEIAIKDTGVGIPNEYIGRIFDPYFTTKEKGNGLGLASSYSIIKNHGGLIDLKSEVGKGSVFLIYLPAVGAGEKAEPVLRAKVAASVRSSKVLVMDDEQLIRNIAGELIKALGHDVDFAAHGTEAIEKYQRAKQSGDPFDVVILDVTIRGGMGGAETFRKLLEIDPDVKTIVSSGYSEDALSLIHNEGRRKVLLKKPYSLDNLRDVLNKLLN